MGFAFFQVEVWMTQCRMRCSSDSTEQDRAAVRTGQGTALRTGEDAAVRTVQGPEQPWQVRAAPCKSSPAQPSLVSSPGAALGAFCTSLHGVCSEAGRGRVPRSVWSPAEQRCECKEQGQSVLGLPC